MSNTTIITKRILSVKRRLHLCRVIRCISYGLGIGSSAMICLFLLCPPFDTLPLFVLLLCTLLGFIAGFFRTPKNAVEKMDEHYQLQDRLLTASELLKRTSPAPIETLQLADAARHSEKVKESEVVPLTFTYPLRVALSLFAVAICCGVLSHHGILPLWFTQYPDDMVYAVAPSTETTNASAAIQDDVLKQVKIFAEQNPNEKAIQQLAEKMEQLMKEIKTSKSNRSETLLKISAMEDELRNALQALQLQEQDKIMQDIGGALSVSKATQSIGKNLKTGKYGKAAEELKMLDKKALDSMTAKEKDTVAKMMNEIAKNLDEKLKKNTQQKKLRDASKEMSDGFGEDDQTKMEQGAEKLADESKRQQVRKSLGEGLEHALAMLEMNKEDFAGGSKQGSGADNGGDNTGKSSRESKSFGSGAAGNPNTGEETQLDVRREQKNIEGSMLGDGDSEFEKTRTAETAEQKSSRMFREQYLHYEKANEAVLESEPLPLGQRRLIRDYFKAVKPLEALQ